MRLQKFLAECGVASRRESEQFIAAGRVTVNDIVAQIGSSVDPDSDNVKLDGASVLRNEKVYIVLHKPKGVVTSARDTHDRRTVLDCVSGISARIFPVGRLDMDVAGALLLTNDGELAYRLTHPKYQVEKVYLAWTQDRMSEESLEKLRRGVLLEDGMTATGKASIVKTTPQATLVRLTIHEGRKRLVKRMLAEIGHPVRDLRRVSIGTIRASGLIPGEWRNLTEAELATLHRLTGLDTP